MNILKSHFSLLFTIIVCLYVLGRQSDKYFGWTNKENISPNHGLTIHTDGAGYYAYLPKTFIYSESEQFSFLKLITDKYKHSHFISGLRFDEEQPNGSDKYYIGTAILSTPLFLVNHWANLLLYGDGDGYSRSYQLTVSLNALLFYLIGIIGLIKFLQLFNLSKSIISLLIIGLTFGTSLNFYTVYFPSFSHVFSFATITWFCYLAFLFGKDQKVKYLYLLILLLGLIFLIRPTNVLVIAIIPFVFSSFSSFIEWLKSLFRSNLFQLLIGSIIFISCVFFQVWTIYKQTGIIQLNTYNAETFTFLLEPKWKEVLFSFKKGYFVYAPLMLLLLPGLFFLFKSNRYFFFGWTILIVGIIYITSSWWCWWYGGGLGMRPLVDFSILLILPVGLLLNYLKFSRRILISFLFIPGIYLYQVYQIQYNKNILHYDGVNKAQFSSVFMKTDDRFSWVLHLDKYSIPKDYKLVKKYYLNSLNKWGGQKVSSDELVLGFETPDPLFWIKPREVKLVGEGFRFSGIMKLTNQESNPSFVLSFFKDGQNVNTEYQYIGNKIDNLTQLADLKT